MFDFGYNIQLAFVYVGINAGEIVVLFGVILGTYIMPLVKRLIAITSRVLCFAGVGYIIP